MFDRAEVHEEGQRLHQLVLVPLHRASHVDHGAGGELLLEARLQLGEGFRLRLALGLPEGQVLDHESSKELAISEVDHLLGRLVGKLEAVGPGEHQAAPSVFFWLGRYLSLSEFISAF